jgi:FtsZ-binding cell division protein ZapB
VQVIGSGGVVFGTADDVLQWNASKGALRTGSATADQWSDPNTGDWSLASGFNALASGTHATSHGFEVQATGLASFAQGARSIASGTYSVAAGLAAEASGLAALALGDSALASGKDAIALGYRATASNSKAIALGDRCTASGEVSFAAGNSTTASGFIATALGSGSEALGAVSLAWGADSRASGNLSMSLGEGTRAESYGESVLGSYNTFPASANPTLFEASDRLLVVGNGTSTFTRSDALVMLKNGNTALGNIHPSTNLEVGGSGPRTVRVSSTSSSDVRYELFRAGSGFFDWRMANSGGDLVFSRSGDELATAAEILRMGSTLLRPGTDNNMQLGSSVNRWSTVFAANGTINTSDARDKTNIQELIYGLEDIRKLRPVSFNWINDQDHGTKLGLIAQDLQQVLPEVVRDWDYTEDEENGLRKVEATRLGVYYSDIIPVLIKGIQELDQQVQDSDSEALQSRVEELEQANETLQAQYASVSAENAAIRDENAAIRAQLNAILDRLNAFDGDLQQCCLSHNNGQQPGPGSSSPTDLPSLGQNIPNPFDGSTLISYYLPQGTTQATLSVSARNGSPVASFELNEPGFGQVSLDGSRLAAGIYFYSLTVEGRLIETRQMVVTH